MNNVCPVVGEREVYAPVCYRSLYGLCVGDKMRIGNEELTGNLSQSFPDVDESQGHSPRVPVTD